MTKEFKPMLIGKYTDRIEFQTASWKNCIFQLNHLFANWNVYFNEKLDLIELAIILNASDIKRDIQEKQILKSPKHADFIKSMSFKIDKMIDSVEVPSFDHLIEAVAKVKAAIYPDPRAELNKFKQVSAGTKPVSEVGELEFNKWKSKIFDGLNFIFTDELKESIIEENSVYTRNIRENAAFVFYSKFSELLNVMNDMGHQLETIDFPIHFHRCLNMENTEKLHTELKVCFCEKKYPIRHFFPSIGMFMPDWNLSTYFENLSDDQVDDLINKYS